jgi:transcription elongation factor Elf1
MAGHCLIVADRRNSEIHSGAAAFEGIDNSKWLPATYEVMDVLLRHLKRDFRDFIEDHSEVALETLKDRRDTIKKDVREKIMTARRSYEAQSPEQREAHSNVAAERRADWLKGSKLRRECECPACKNESVIGGETVSRSPVKIDEDSNTIRREVRVLPNKLRCSFCGLLLNSFQEVNEAGMGNIYTIVQEEDPIEFFGIDPEEYVDVEELVARHAADFYEGYNNE